MRAATLFSGIGAPEQAMPGWSWLWHAEIDPFPCAVMAARHPRSVNLGDVSAPDFAERAAHVGRPNVLVFGSPCQSFSLAGRRLGLDDPRGNLALVALGVVGQLRPDWFVFENVPGLLSSDGGRDFGAFLGIVGQLGYGWAYRVIDAQYFGVPQRRRRVFIVGCLGDWRRAAAVLFEPASLRGHPAPSREAGQGAAAHAARSVALRGRDGGGAIELGAQRASQGGGDKPHVLAFGGNDTRGPIDVATARNAHGGPHGRLDFESETFAVQPCAFNARQSDVGVYGDRAGTLDTDAFSQAVAFAENSHAELRLEGGDGRTVGSLNAGGGKPGQGYPAIAEGMRVRRLTPAECERLQGFPDDFTAVEFRGRPAADGPRYRAIGNSMAVPVMRWILTRLEAAHAAMTESEAA